MTDKKNMQTKPISRTLTEVLARLTPDAPKITKESLAGVQTENLSVEQWAAWLKFETHGDPQLESLVLDCAKFALRFKHGNQPGWISFVGSTGTGKTHSGRRLWNHLSARASWRGCKFVQKEIYWPKFVSELRSGDAFEQFRDMMSWPVLFVDDIGAERDTTGFVSEQLNTLMGCRVEKWTIITSNLSLSQLGDIDPRIADRIIRSPNIITQLNTTSHSLR